MRYHEECQTSHKTDFVVKMISIEKNHLWKQQMAAVVILINQMLKHWIHNLIDQWEKKNAQTLNQLEKLLIFT